MATNRNTLYFLCFICNAASTSGSSHTSASNTSKGKSELFTKEAGALLSFCTSQQQQRVSSPRSPAVAPGWWCTSAAGPAPAPCSSPGGSSPAQPPAAGLQERLNEQEPDALQRSSSCVTDWDLRSSQAAL